MPDTPIKLYACPHGCPLVSHLALEYAGASFSYELVDVPNGKQFSPDYVALSPRSKIPLLVAGEERVLENPAILLWIAQHFPEARLLPAAQDADFIAAVSDLSWCASGVQPQISRLIRPENFYPLAEGHEAVRELARKGLAKEFALIDRRLENRAFWNGRVSALDFYLFWIWARTGEGSFDLAPYPAYRRLMERMLDLPFVQRVLARERAILPCFEGLPY